MFLLITNLVNSIAGYVQGKLAESLHLVNPADNKKEYGYLITCNTLIPCVLSIPFFLCSGYKMVEIKRKKIALGILDKATLE